MTTTTVPRTLPARGLRYHSLGWLLVLLLGGVSLAAAIGILAATFAYYAL